LQSDPRATEILRHVVEGKTLKEAGALIGVGAGQARHLLTKICRQLRMPESLAEIKRDRQSYLIKLPPAQGFSWKGLNANLLTHLISVLHLRSPEEFSPDYASNLTASQLHVAGVSLDSIADLQSWLLQSNRTLRRRPPESDEELQAARRAIDLLDSLQFDVANTRVQFAFVTNAL
jgi:DNA-binding CsgD family transcriptional regulator